MLHPSPPPISHQVVGMHRSAESRPAAARHPIRRWQRVLRHKQRKPSEGANKHASFNDNTIIVTISSRFMIVCGVRVVRATLKQYTSLGLENRTGNG